MREDQKGLRKLSITSIAEIENKSESKKGTVCLFALINWS